jgi:replicative DNA helicase
MKPREMPHCEDEEAGVIGHCMSYLDGYEQVKSLLKPSHFYHPKNQEIWRAIVSAQEKGMHSDPVAVFGELPKAKQVNRVVMIGNLIGTHSCPKRNLVPYALKIREMAIHRGRIEVAQRMMDSAFDAIDDPLDALDADKRAIASLEPTYSPMTEMSDLVIPVIDDLEAAMRGESRALRFGFREFDADYAFLPSEIVIIGADSGTGKTGFTLQVVKRMRKLYPHMPWIFNSLEMQDKQLTSRDMASSVGISGMRMRTGDNVTALNIGDMALLPTAYKGIFVVRCKTQADVEEKIKQCKKLLGLAHDAPIGVVSDYIQLMRGVGGNREQEVGNIARDGQQLAKDHNALYIMLSQFNKSAKKERPNSGSLRDSGSIEHVADWIFLGYNPFRQGELFYEDGSSTEGIIEWNAYKVRFGAAGDTKKVRMDKAGLFRDIQDGTEYEESLNLPVMKPNNKIFNEPSHSDEQPEKEGGGDFFPF